MLNPNPNAPLSHSLLKKPLALALTAALLPVATVATAQQGQNSLVIEEVMVTA